MVIHQESLLYKNEKYPTQKSRDIHDNGAILVYQIMIRNTQNSNLNWYETAITHKHAQQV